AYGQLGYGQDVAAQQQAYGTGAQQAYDASAYGQQGYDPSQYAPQSTEQFPQTTTGEQAAQDAIQYGWYQGTEQQAADTPSGSGVEIGRASCRERVEMSVVDGSVKRK